MPRRTTQMSESLMLGITLTIAGGFQDAYSYNCRGQVFANAQTGNIVLLGQNLASGNFQNALHYLLPLLAFFAGVYLSERIRHFWEKRRILHWRQTVLLIEIAMLMAAGLLPQNLNILANGLLSFACAMQVDSFRKFRGIPCATTMCIGNMRSAAEMLCKYRLNRDPELKRKSLYYCLILLVFAAGAAAGAIATQKIGNHAIWIPALLMLTGFFMMFIKEGAPSQPS